MPETETATAVARMPELPEVECVRRGLERAQLRGPLANVWRSRQALRTGAHWRDEQLHLINDTQAGTVHRRGKFLVWKLLPRTGSPRALVIHLGMTGRLTLKPSIEPDEKHTHLVLGFQDGRAVHFIDPRRFGGLRAGLWDQLFAQPPLADLGIEPLTREFNGVALAQAVKASTRALRDVLLDQCVVAGIGNIYVSEALFVAGIHPLTRANRLRESAWTRVAAAVKQVLNQGLRNGGTSLRDYQGTTGERGRNQDTLLVYGRAGQSCRKCGTDLLGYAHAGRSGVLCPVDQPKLRRRWVE